MANENFNPTLSSDEVWMGTDSSACLTDCTGIENKTYPGCYYRTVDGVTEWINPPMVVGTEYRTTERWDGKPIYVKIFNFGKMPNNDTSTLIHNIGNLDKVIRVSGTLSNGSVIPHRASNVDFVDVGADKTAIHIYTTMDYSYASAYIQLWYTKN